MRFSTSQKIAASFLLVLSFHFALESSAYAAPGRFRMCINKSTGNILVKRKCRKIETEVSLASLQSVLATTGPEGPQGERGERGPRGFTGEQGPQGEQGLEGVLGYENKAMIINFPLLPRRTTGSAPGPSCSPGKVVLGGACRSLNADNVGIINSYPDLGAGPDGTTQWWCGFENRTGGDVSGNIIRAYIICAIPG